MVDVINQLVSILQADEDLTAFCRQKWGKPLSVKKIFKRRTEINLHDLPIILITRPSIQKTYPIISAPKASEHTVRLYYGFHQNDKRIALEESIGYEEEIDDCLSAHYSLGLPDTVLKTVSSINDEGEFHPVYFGVMDVEVTHRRL